MLAETEDDLDSADRSSWVRTISPPSPIHPRDSDPGVKMSLMAN
jgi:hypothetical protein